MEHSPSCEGNRYSATREIPVFYGSWRFITAFITARHLSISRPCMHPTSLRPLLILFSHLRLGVCLGCTEGLVRIQGSCIRFVTWLSFYGEELLASRPTPKLEDHLVSAVRECLFNIFSNYPPYLEAVPPSATWGRAVSWWQGPTYHCDRDPFITVTVSQLSLWQGPTYHCDRNPLITGKGSWRTLYNEELYNLHPHQILLDWRDGWGM